MHPRELPANLDNLLGTLPLRQDDLGEAHAALAIEVERVVGARHAGDSIRIVRRETEEVRGSTSVSARIFGPPLTSYERRLEA